MFDLTQIDREDAGMAVGAALGIGIGAVLTAILDGTGRPLEAVLYAAVAGVTALLFVALE